MEAGKLRVRVTAMSRVVRFPDRTKKGGYQEVVQVVNTRVVKVEDLKRWVRDNPGATLEDILEALDE